MASFRDRVRWLGVIGLIAVTLPGQARGAAEGGEVCRRHLDSLSGVRSLKVTYRARNRSLNVRPDDRFILTSIAIKGELRLATTAHLRPGMTEMDDSLYNISLYTVKNFNAAFPVERVYLTSAEHALPVYTIKVRSDPILEALSWWPADDPSETPVFRQQPFFLKDLLARAKPRTLQGTEMIDGCQCETIEFPELDTFWFDSRNGRLVKRRHFIDASKRHAMEYAMQDYRPVAKGLALPFRITRSQVDVEEHVATSVDTYEVVKYEINTLTDGDFTYRPAPGTLICDRDRDEWRQVPGGLDFLEEVIPRIRAVVGQVPSVAGPRPSWRVVPAFAGLGIVAALAPFFASRVLGKIRSVPGPIEHHGHATHP